MSWADGIQQEDIWISDNPHFHEVLRKVLG